jgi:hypothetical protein
VTDQLERATKGSKHVLVVSGHRHGSGSGRRCPMCGSVWTVEFEDGEVLLWRDGMPESGALLDASGHHAAVDCCPPRPVAVRTST